MPLWIVTLPTEQDRRIMIVMDPRMERTSVIRTITDAGYRLVGFGRFHSMVIVERGFDNAAITRHKNVTGAWFAVRAAWLYGCAPTSDTPRFGLTTAQVMMTDLDKDVASWT